MEMDFTSAMETFAEAWVAANTQTAVTDQSLRHTPLEELPTMVNTEQLSSVQGQIQAAAMPPPGGSVVNRSRSHDPTVAPPSHTPSPSKLTSTPSSTSTRAATSTSTVTQAAHSPPSSTGKSKPIHCVVEHASASSRPSTPPSAKSSAPCESNVELDTYAILPSNTLFSEIVRVALVKLGYTAAEAIGAKGAIQIKNWKPLTFDTITENPDATVDEILGDLTSLATLRIKLGSRTKSHSVDGVKEKLLQFLLQHSQSMLMSTGCPIDKNFLSAIGKGEYPATMPDDMRRSFERWYRDQTRQQGKGGSPVSSTASSPESGKENRFDPTAMFGAHFAHTPGGYPALRGELNTTHFSRTRIRTSFDPDLEIPRLQRWFEQNQHPTRDQMIFYLNELNSLESRRGRKPLDLTNIIYWFKNARAAQRRAHRSPEPENRPEGEPDDSMEERLSPEPAKEETSTPRATTPTGSSTEDVPVLPNRNAVYVVNEPLHLYKKEESEGDSNVMHIEPEEPADQKSPRDNNTTPNHMDHPKNSPRESHDSGNGSDADQGAPVVIEPRSPSSMPQNLTVGVKRSSECLESDVSEDEFDEDNDKEPKYNGEFNSPYNVGERYRPHVQTEVNGGGSSSSPSPSSSIGNSMSPLQHAGIMQTHPLLTPPGLGATMSPRQQPPPAHQQALAMHHHPHLPHPLNMHLFPHPLYNPIDTSALMGGSPRPFKDSPSPTSMSDDHRKKRSRVFIDPLTEIPKLEKWFLEDTHPSSYMIEKYTEELNRSEYRQRFPKLEPKNVQLWFKNHRAKVKRQRFEHSAELMHGNNGQSSEVKFDHSAELMHGNTGQSSEVHSSPH